MDGLALDSLLGIHPRQLPEEADLMTKSARVGEKVGPQLDASDLCIPVGSDGVSVAPSSVKAEDGAVTYTISTDSSSTSADGTTVSPPAGQSATVTAVCAIGGKRLLPVMNMTSVAGAGIPVIQAAGFRVNGDGDQGALPMVIPGVGNSGPLAFIYPAIVAESAPPTSVVVSQTDALPLTSDVITVTPQSEPPVITVTPQSEPLVMTSGGGGAEEAVVGEGGVRLKHAREDETELMSIRELASQATNSSLHSAITNQIIMEIKNETAPPCSAKTEEKASSSDTSIRSPMTTGDESEEGMYMPKAKRSKSSSSIAKEDKICRVCGDRALGCNFDAISCESCKAFFRRNALKEKQPKCLFDGSCKIDVNTRRFCPFCRLQKCFTVGMKKELILGEVEKKKRNEKVRMNREKRSGKSCSSSQASCSSVETLAPMTPGMPVSPSIDASPVAQQPVSSIASHEALLQSLTSHSPKQETVLPTSQPPSTSVFGIGLTLGGMSFSVAGSSLPQANSVPSVVHSAPDVTNLLSLSKFAQKNEMSSVQLDTFLVRHLTPEENNMLQELMQVYDLSFTVDLEPLIHIKHLDPSLNQLVNQSSITVLRLIKFAKRLDEFIRLTQQCQIGILKGTWIHILLLRSVSLYDSERDVWVTPKGDIPTEILKNATGFVKLHDDHVQYCKNIKMIIRDDLMIVVILLVIVLFSPEGPNVINRDLVSNIQDKYLILLKHYLESKYTYIRAAEMYPALMSKLKELKELAEVHGKYLLDVNPSEIEPIMLEILDLK